MNDLSKSEQKLLRKAEASDSGFNRWQSPWALFLIPPLFIAATLPPWIRVAQTWKPVIAVQIKDELIPLQDISLSQLVAINIIMLGIIITFACWLVVSLNRERRMFWNIIRNKMAVAIL